MKMHGFKMFFVTAALSTCALSCARVTVDPIEVKPIHITMDVNIKVDQQLNDFFAFEDKYNPAATQPAATTATTQTSAKVTTP